MIVTSSLLLRTADFVFTHPVLLQGAYFLGLSATLRDDSKLDDNRRLAGLLIKNALDAEVRIAATR